MKRILLDSCVLIDYFKTEAKGFEFFRFLSLCNEPLAIDVLIEEECPDYYTSSAQHFISIINATEEENAYADEHQHDSGLSFYDMLFWKVATERNFDFCCTNDKLLKTKCIQSGLEVHGGLYLLYLLAQQKVLTKPHAKRIADALQQTNPAFINSNVMAQFINLINKLN